MEDHFGNSACLEAHLADSSHPCVLQTCPALIRNFSLAFSPLSMADLRGRVVLVRWWTDTCPMCASTSPTLRKFNEEYSAKGLTVIGVFHPKFGRDKPMDIERVRRAVVSRQYAFPVAVDWEWRTLRSWWLDSRPEGVRSPASVSFILDRKGVVRYVHPGMEYHEGAQSEAHVACDNDFHAIRAAIERLLAE